MSKVQDKYFLSGWDNLDHSCQAFTAVVSPALYSGSGRWVMVGGVSFLILQVKMKRKS